MMEFLDKKHRIVLMAVAQGGPAGVTREELFQNMTLVMSKDTLSAVLEDLYFSGDIKVLRDGNEIRYLASKEIRESMIALELQRFRLAGKLEKLKEASKNEEKDKVQLLLNEIRDVSVSISTSIISLMKNSPSLTIPEYLESIDIINKDFLSKIVPLLEEKPSQRELEILIGLVSKYRGEKDAEKLKLALEKISQAGQVQQNKAQDLENKETNNSS
jgi:hemerythrin superfamily protein